MYEGYLKVNGVEVINGHRTGVYVSTLTRVDIKCAHDTLADALLHDAYSTPAEDGAPWYTQFQEGSGGFYGLFPGRFEGVESSTRSVTVTELSGDGAVMTSPRYGGKEIRVVATAFAADEEGMEQGMAWLRQVLAGNGCSDAEPGCTGTELEMFTSAPVDALEAYAKRRLMVEAEVSDPLQVVQKYPSKQCVIWDVEFTFTVGKPWQFTSLADIAELDMDTALNFQDPEGEDCSVSENAYDDFVADPYFTAISRPPRPPVILPPNILNITSWRRLEAAIPSTQTERWGRTVPVVKVFAWDQEIQYLRLRFYRDANVGCDFDGEFIVSYLPYGAILTLDGVRREASVTLAGGKVVPAGNLLFGSGGRPFTWPSLGCQREYRMTADLMPGQPGVTVTLQTAVRE